MKQHFAQGRAQKAARRAGSARFRSSSGKGRRWHERSTMDRRASELPLLRSGELLMPCPGRDEEE